MGTKLGKMMTYLETPTHEITRPFNVVIKCEVL